MFKRLRLKVKENEYHKSDSISFLERKQCCDLQGALGGGPPGAAARQRCGAKYSRKRGQEVQRPIGRHGLGRQSARMSLEPSERR